MSMSNPLPGERLQRLARRFTEPEGNPDIGSKAFAVLLVLACVAVFLMVALGLWARG